MLRFFSLLTLGFFATPAIAQDAIVQGVYNGYAACLLARVSPDGALTPIGYEEIPGDIDPAPYRVFGLTGELATADGAAPALGECGCLEVPQVALTGAEEVAEGPLFAASTLGAAAPLKLQSLSPENETYIAAAAEILAERGLPDAPVKLLQVLRTDIEGDGVDEVLFTAGVAGGSLDGHTQGFDAVLGDYAFVALRHLVDGEVKTDLIEASFVADQNEPYSQIIFNLVGLADVTGDGIAELVVEMQGHEFGGFRLYRWQDGAFQSVNDCGCGC